jgi:hypothetical protein
VFPFQLSAQTEITLYSNIQKKEAITDFLLQSVSLRLMLNYEVSALATAIVFYNIMVKARLKCSNINATC